MNRKQFVELLLQSLEHEQGGVLVYQTAITCAVRDDLKDEWREYLEQTKNHVAVLNELCAKVNVDPAKQTPGRAVVRLVGGALVQAMEQALAAGEPGAAQLVACECVVLAETKDHFDWELIGQCAKAMEGAEAEAVKAAYESIEAQEDEHLYHTKGWCRELWLESLGFNALLPPLEERKKVRTAIGAAKAQLESALRR